MTLLFEQVKHAPSVLEGTEVTATDVETLGDPLPSWSILNKLLVGFTSDSDRLRWTKKALLLELSGKARTYESGRLLTYIVQANTKVQRDSAMAELQRCIS